MITTEKNNKPGAHLHITFHTVPVEELTGNISEIKKKSISDCKNIGI